MQVKDYSRCEACPESYCSCYVEHGYCIKPEHVSCFESECLQYLKCTQSAPCDNQIRVLEGREGNEKI